MKRTLLLVLTGIFLCGGTLSEAQDQAQTRDTLQQQKQVYGWQLMNTQERHEYQNQMREMKTAEEREG
jgi:hypothetical protein